MRCPGTRKDGQPCTQRNGTAERPYCVWHDPRLGEEGRRAVARKGGYSSLLGRVRTLPAGTDRPEFATRESIVTWAQDTALLVLTGKLDPRLAAEARQLAALALQARTAEAQERLVEALLRVEHGGAAVMLLARLQDGLSTGRTRPLGGAGRVLPMPTTPEGDGS